jgi:hypothetical protein
MRWKYGIRECRAGLAQNGTSHSKKRHIKNSLAVPRSLCHSLKAQGATIIRGAQAGGHTPKIDFSIDNGPNR